MTSILYGICFNILWIISLIKNIKLDNKIIETKSAIKELFIELDSMYLIQFSVEVVNQGHLDQIKQLEENKKTVETTISKIEFPMFSEYLKNDFTKYYK